MPPHERRARAQGLPILGSGLVYPVEEKSITVEPFPIPREWPRCFGLDSDAGAGWTAIVWLAWDRDGGVIYVTHTYKSDSRSKADHVDALRAKGTKRHPLWIKGVGDAGGLLVTKDDSIKVLELYQDSGVDIELPDKAVTAGTQAILDLMRTGRFKVFSTESEWFAEFRMYHRKDGKIVKINDHLMDATRYAVRSGLDRADVAPVDEDAVESWMSSGMGTSSWMGM